MFQEGAVPPPDSDEVPAVPEPGTARPGQGAEPTAATASEA